MKVRYRKSPAVKQLEALANAKARERYPKMPYLAPRKYRDDSANGLTKCVIHWLRLNGNQAERTSVTGRYLDRSKVVTDVLGRQRKIGTGKWIRTSGQRGSADISATVNGQAVKVEVKIGRDRQSKYQKAYQQTVEGAGGKYLIIQTFEQFLNELKYI